MGLKSKSILAVNAIVIIACVLMGIIGYFRAEEGFAKALQMKAAADVQSLSEILNYRYEGDWHLRNGLLFKGEQQIDGADGLVDSLSQICNGKVTIFNGDTRVATTVKDSSGKVIGMIQRNYNISTLADFLKKEADSETELAIFESSGKLVAHSSFQIAKEEDRIDMSGYDFIKNAGNDLPQNVLSSSSSP